MRWAPVVAAALLALTLGADALTFHLESHAEECFSEHVKATRTKVAMHYQVVHGGGLDVDVTVRSPKDRVLYEAVRENEGRLSFTSDDIGPYSLCFTNGQSSVAAKTVAFKITVGDTSDSSGVAKAEHFTPLETSLAKLGEMVRTIQDEQQFARTREAAHRDIAESVNSRVQWWSVCEAVVLFLVSAWQIVYIRRIVDVRRLSV